MKIFGWEYSYNSGTEEFNIIPDRPIKRPRTFFKYYGISDNSVKALIGLYIYASHPNQLNDSVDCHTKIINIDNLQDAKALWNVQYDNLVKKSNGDIVNILQLSNETFKILMYKKLGLFSLTDSRLNNALWAYYTNSQGFCLEFDTDKFPFRTLGPFPINYQKEILPINTSHYGIYPALAVQTNVKKDCWKHENEWRLLIPSPEGFDMLAFGPDANQYNHISDHDRKFRYTLSALKSVTLASQFFMHKTMCIIQINEYEIHVKLKEQSNQSKILDFLSNPQVTADVKIYYLIEQGIGNFRPNEISIIKTDDLQYRVIELK